MLEEYQDFCKARYVEDIVAYFLVLYYCKKSIKVKKNVNNCQCYELLQCWILIRNGNEIMSFLNVAAILI